MTPSDQSPRPLAAAIVLLAAVLMISRLIIERAPARDWIVPLLLLALGIGLLLWDSFARRPRPSWPGTASAAQSDHTLHVAIPAAAPIMSPAAKPPAPVAEPEPPSAPVEPSSAAPEPPAPVAEPEPPSAPVEASSATPEPPAPVAEPDPPSAPVEASSATPEPPAPVAEPEPPSAPAEPRKRASKAAAKEAGDKQPARKRAAAGDDLTLIEGIGPKISAALIAAGISTFADLAAAPETRVREILTAAQLRIVGSVSESIPTWAEQAGLAAAGRLDDLKAWQAAHKGGKG